MEKVQILRADSLLCYQAFLYNGRKITYAYPAITLKTPNAAAHVTSRDVGAQRIHITRISSIVTFVDICKIKSMASLARTAHCRPLLH